MAWHEAPSQRTRYCACRLSRVSRGADDLGAVQQQRHLAVAEAVRREQLELVGEPERELVAADDGVDVRARAAGRRR